VRKQSQIVLLYKYLNTYSKPEKPCIFVVFIYSWASKHPCSHAHSTTTDQAIRRWLLTLSLRACTQLVFFHAVDSSKLIRVLLAPCGLASEEAAPWTADAGKPRLVTTSPSPHLTPRTDMRHDRARTPALWSLTLRQHCFERWHDETLASILKYNPN